MNKIILITLGKNERRNFTTGTHTGIIPRCFSPISSLTLASYLEKHNVETIILDTRINNEKKLKKTIIKNDLILIGITTHIGASISEAIEITSFIKTINPFLPIVWGGPLVACYPKSCFKAAKIDYAILYNGEFPLLQLIKYLQKKCHISDVPNCFYKEKNGRIYFTKTLINSPIYNDKLNWRLLGKKVNVNQNPYVISMHTSRGCKYKCKFCFKNSCLSKPKYQSRTPSSVLQEMDFLYSNYGINIFTISDDNFLALEKRAIKILNRMKKENYKIEACAGFLHDLSDNILSALSGVCNRIDTSVETASKKISKNINKEINFDRLYEIEKKIFDLGITSRHNFVFGFPEETDEDRRKAIDLMIKLKKINPNTSARSYIFSPLPKTILFGEIENNFSQFPTSLDFWQLFRIRTEDEDLNEDLKIQSRFRPWLREVDLKFIWLFSNIFSKIFEYGNTYMDNDIQKAIFKNPRLSRTFSEYINIKLDKPTTSSYILDNYLKKILK